jgi:hypothetical protein
MAKKETGKVVLSKKKSVGGHAKSDSDNKTSKMYSKKYKGQGR